MALPVAPAKTEKRDKPVTVRLPKEAVKRLLAIAKATNMSQSQVIELLIGQEFESRRKAYSALMKD